MFIFTLKYNDITLGIGDRQIFQKYHYIYILYWLTL